MVWNSDAGRAYRRARPDLAASWRDAEFCVLDLETTGLDARHDRIVSFGVVPVRAGRIRVAEAVYRQVRPQCDVPPESTRVHALRDVDLADAPTLGSCTDELLAALTGRVLVAHAAWVERSFLSRLLRRHWIRLRAPVIDTAGLARHLPELPRHPRRAVALEHAAQVFDLPVHTPHHALGDAMTTAQLFLVLATRLSAGEPLSVGRLATLSRWEVSAE